jgi:hypothetical protein
LSKNGNAAPVPGTGYRWVKKSPRAKGFVVRLIQHGGRVHLGIPRALSRELDLRAGDVVLVDLRGKTLVVERMRVVSEFQREVKA